MLSTSSDFRAKPLTSPALAYLGHDYPQTWPIAVPPARLAVSHSVRYTLDTPSGIAEWSSVVPGGDGLVHLGPHRQPFTVALFHQLRCLDVIRTALVAGEQGDVRDKEDGGIVEHCLGYVRQMILCHGDTFLEPYAHPNHKDPIDMDRVYECRDWSAVFAETTKNQEEHKRWLKVREDRDL